MGLVIESNLALKCFEQLQNEIINGILQPGQKLKMSLLKDKLNMGQSPIREALSRLTQAGLVEAEENKGFRVAQMSEQNIRDTYHVYLAIELLAIEQAMRLGDDSWEATIVSTLHQLARIELSGEPTSYAIWSERNYNFHVALISGCNSPLLLELRAMVFKRFDRYCRIAFYQSQTTLHLNHEEHRQLAQAVIERNTTTVRTLLEHHILGALEEVIVTLKTNKLL